jgi:hypothetical protein
MFCNIFIATKMNRTRPLVFMAADSSKTYVCCNTKMNPISRSTLRRKPFFLFSCLSGHKESNWCSCREDLGQKGW